MRIRVATHEDGERIVEMAVRFIETTIYGKLVAWTPEGLADLIDETLTHGVIYVAEADHFVGRLDAEGVDQHPAPTLVGMIALVGRIHPMNGSAYGDELAWWVEPEYRNSTAAYRLLGAAEDWADANRLSVLKVSAPAGSTIGTAYERRGYAHVESVYQKTFHNRSEDPMPKPTSDNQRHADKDHKDQKQHVKDQVAKHAKPRDRFVAHEMGVLDGAMQLINSGATKEQLLSAIAEYRNEIPEAADHIFGGNK